MVFKCVHGQAPTYLSELVQPKRRDRRLRQADALTLQQPMAKKLVGNQSFGIAAPRLWNELPQRVRTASTQTCFKKELKTYIFSKHFD